MELRSHCQRAQFGDCWAGPPSSPSRAKNNVFLGRVCACARVRQLNCVKPHLRTRFSAANLKYGSRINSRDSHILTRFKLINFPVQSCSGTRLSNRPCIQNCRFSIQGCRHCIVPQIHRDLSVYTTSGKLPTVRVRVGRVLF